MTTHTPATSLETPPHSLEAERCILGALIDWRRAANTITPQLAADDFYATPHATLYTRILQLAAVDQPHDLAALGEELKQHPIHGLTRLDLANIYEAAPLRTPEAVTYWLERVRDLSRRRRIIQTASQLQHDAHHADPHTAISHAQTSLEHIRATTTTSLEPDPDIYDLIDRPEATYDWIIPDLLDRGDRLILTGGEGDGKSTLLRQIAIQTAAGIHPFALLNTPPMRVLYIDLENPEGHVAREFDKLLPNARNQLARNQLIVICRPDGIDLLDAADALWLDQRIAANTPDLLIIGPTYKLAAGNHDDYQIVTAIVRLLDQLRVRHQHALMLEAHSPHEQPGQTRGRPSNARIWMRWPEFGFGLQARSKHPDETRFELVRWRRQRDAERNWPRGLRRGGAWKWTIDLDTDDDTEGEGWAADDNATILRILHQHGPHLSKTSIRRHARRNSSRVDDALTRLLRSGQVGHDPRRGYHIIQATEPVQTGLEETGAERTGQ